MFDQTKEEARLIELNSGTFHAEAQKPINGQEWDAFLQHVLSEDFWIRRANSGTSLQNKDGMIAHIRSSKPNERTFDKVSAQVIGDYGIVTCVIMLHDSKDKFHNFKVFARHLEDWQCIYWRVTKVQAAG